MEERGRICDPTKYERINSMNYFCAINTKKQKAGYIKLPKQIAEELEFVTEGHIVLLYLIKDDGYSIYDAITGLRLGSGNTKFEVINIVAQFLLDIGIQRIIDEQVDHIKKWGASPTFRIKEENAK